MTWNDFGWLLAGIVWGPAVHTVIKTAGKIIRNAWLASKEEQK